jgi:uncharacterized protein with PIN domain
MKLLTDTMLGRLTTYLRMCGYDTVYTLDEDLEGNREIREYAAAEGRRLVTRNRDLAARTDGTILLESRDLETMLSTLQAEGFELSLPEHPQRCSSCNGTVERVGPDEQTPEYAPNPRSIDVWRCTECGQHSGREVTGTASPTRSTRFGRIHNGDNPAGSTDTT